MIGLNIVVLTENETIIKLTPQRNRNTPNIPIEALIISLIYVIYHLKAKNSNLRRRFLNDSPMQYTSILDLDI